MGIRTALLNPRLRSIDEIGDYYQHYRSIGMVELVQENSTEIERWINANMEREGVPEDYSQYDQAYANVINFLAHPHLQSAPAG